MGATTIMSSRTAFARAYGVALAFFATFGLAAPGHAVSYQDATGAPVKAAFAEGRLRVLSDKGVLMKTVGDYRVTFALPGVVAIRAADGPILLAPR